MSFIWCAWFGTDVLVSVYYCLLWTAKTIVSFIYTWSLLPTKLYWLLYSDWFTSYLIRALIPYHSHVLLLLNYVVLRALWKIDVHIISTIVNKSLYYYYYFYYTFNISMLSWNNSKLKLLNNKDVPNLLFFIQLSPHAPSHLHDFFWDLQSWSVRHGFWHWRPRGGGSSLSWQSWSISRLDAL